MRQDYANYTANDHLMWEQLFERQMRQLPAIASQEYLDGINKVGYVANHIPDFESETNPRLRKLTGWEVYAVPGLIPHREFYEHLANRQFPASTWLRKPDQLEYLEEPDMFHDTFGHVPLFSNPDFCRFIHDLSAVALKFIDHEEALEHLSRLYWYTVEFGLIRENGVIKIYGGGILSSVGESIHCLKKSTTRKPFSSDEILNTPYQIDRFQDFYFVIESYEQLFKSLPDIEKHLVSLKKVAHQS